MRSWEEAWEICSTGKRVRTAGPQTGMVFSTSYRGGKIQRQTVEEMLNLARLRKAQVDALQQAVETGVLVFFCGRQKKVTLVLITNFHEGDVDAVESAIKSLGDSLDSDS